MRISCKEMYLHQALKKFGIKTDTSRGIMMYEEKLGGKPELLDSSMVTSRFSIRYKILKD